MSKTVSQSPGQDMAQFVHYNVLGSDYEITGRYSSLKPVGAGVSGIVCSAYDQLAGETVAIKKLSEPFKSAHVAKHMFREVKLLKMLQHDNIIHMKDIFISPTEDIYIITDRLAVDLGTLLASKKLEDQFTQYFMYQIMRGLKYVHSAGVVHRDLKPSNILVNENCDLKICDFGLARLQKTHMTGYVSTRYYRAPEIMLTWRRYNAKVDIWSAGCIFGEMMLGKPLLPGKSHIDQFYTITQLLGSPPDELTANVTNTNTLDFIKSCPRRSRKPLSKLIPSADRRALQLLDSMLQYVPEKRCSAAEALESHYLAPYHDGEDEPVAEQRLDWSFLEADLPADVWKTVMYSEILGYLGDVSGLRTPESDNSSPDAMDISAN
ncbi:hypothetical protein N7468_005939 [Penicillium chermesinum]|uniref:Mitogen-activated protein kinase n=1 Tax=Penicillium chermesinum TaxID=63820 RepID=A0A9W9P086_9EURO|nr:uncharacterized protein N7468_005939 [Penicillium chermesinum]KAJ5232983.1 hypothetical protein N7468_005939 [Penicillium chermesinum]KAJ6172629.1 hypothetical protein N7470_001696 [Penicillium chermesinum]